MEVRSDSILQIHRLVSKLFSLISTVLIVSLYFSYRDWCQIVPITWIHRFCSVSTVLPFAFFRDLNRCKSAEGKAIFRYRLLDFETTQGSRLSCVSTYANLLAVGTEAGVVFLFYYNRDWSEKVRIFIPLAVDVAEF